MMNDDYSPKSITEEFMAFKGFDISTKAGRKEAIEWLEKASGNDMFFLSAEGWTEEQLEVDNFIGEMRRGTMLDYLKGL